MSNFVEAFRFIFRNGQIPGQPHFTTLTYFALGTLKVTVIAMAISLVIALPIGVGSGTYTAARSWPSTSATCGAHCRAWSCWRSARVPRYRLENVLLALVVLAVPPIITNAYVGIDEVDRDLVDAARGMGMTGRQVLTEWSCRWRSRL